MSVAAGAAWAALGSDTGGSIRIPAALQGLVGFKNTARLTPTDGAVPLSTDARHGLRDHALGARRGAAARGAGRSARSRCARRPLARLALRRAAHADARRPRCRPSPRAFERSLAGAARRPARAIETIELPLLAEVAAINASGGFAAGRELGLAPQLPGRARAPTTTRASRCASGAARR